MINSGGLFPTVCNTVTGRVTNGLSTVLFNSSVRRTQVLDDESDYFATDSNQWLSPNEREKLRKKEEELRELRHASRKDRKITLDFAGRQVIDEGSNLDEYYKKWDHVIQPVLIAPVESALMIKCLFQNGWNTEGYEQRIHVNVAQILWWSEEWDTEG